MKKLTLITSMLTFFWLAGAMAFAQQGGGQTAFNQNNQNRAIGIARSALSNCLSNANSQGPATSVYPEARGALDANGQLTIWTVVFRDANNCTFNGRFCEDNIVGFVRLENWNVTYAECR